MDAVDPLVRRAQAGEESAFREIFVRHRGEVTRLVFRLIGQNPDVEDVVQDVFIHVYRSLPSFRGDSKFSTWLYRLTVNVTRMHLRKGRSRPRIADAEVPEAPPDGEPSATPDREIDRAARVRALYSLLDRLSEKKRTVLVLHDFEGLSAKAIADVLEVPVLTVRTRLFYARKELYQALSADPHLGPAVESLLPSLHGKPQAEREEPVSSSPRPAGDARDSHPERER